MQPSDPGRRALLGFLVTAPFIVRASSLMPVKLFVPDPPRIDIELSFLIIYEDGTQERVPYKGGGWHTLTTHWSPVTDIISAA